MAVGCGIAVAINVGKVHMSLDLLRQEFGLSLGSAGWVASMLSTLAVFCALFIGVLCDRIGHLRITGIGLAISIAATLAGLFVHDSGGLLLSRFGEGVGFLAVLITALVARRSAWQDALRVTGSAAIVGMLLGLAIYRREERLAMAGCV